MISFLACRSRPSSHGPALAAGHRVGLPLGGPSPQYGHPQLRQRPVRCSGSAGCGGRSMLITKAALGHPRLPACRSFTASTMSSQAHTSHTRGLQGIRTTSAARMASAFTREMPGGQSMTTQAYSPAAALAWRTNAPASALCTPGFGVRSGVQVGPPRRAVLGIGVQEQHPPGVRQGGGQVGGQGRLPDPALLVDYGDHRHGRAPPAVPHHPYSHAPIPPEHRCAPQGEGFSCRVFICKAAAGFDISC